MWTRRNSSRLIALVSCVLACHCCASAQDAASDSAARTAIFGSDLLAQNARTVYERAMQLTPDERYRFLREHVWPKSPRSRPRMVGCFSPTNLHTRSGGALLSPVVALIEAARLTDQTDSLFSDVEQWNAEGDAQRCRFALLAILEISRDRTDAATGWLAELSRLVSASKTVPLEKRWPELTAVSVASEIPQLQGVSSEILHVLAYRVEGSEAQPLRSHALALLGKVSVSLKTAQYGDFEVKSDTTAAPRDEWVPVTVADAASSAQGLALPRWRVRRGEALSVAGHSTDQLIYTIPLEGNYEVEGDLATWSGSLSLLSVGGRWVAQTADTILISGVFRTTDSKITLDPPLSRRPAWTRFRVVARDGRFSVMINGVKVHEYSDPADHDPWLSLRSRWRYPAGFRGLRITGNPTIPDQIALLTAANLPGWRKYNPAVSKWTHTAEHPNGGVIGERYDPSMNGAAIQNLLYYRRPLLEDGVIEYEFYYEPGVAGVHPAIGRTAFILQPDRVRTHHVTNGMHDRTVDELTELTDESQASVGPAGLPLRAGEWNQVRLSIAGDTVSLSLNGETVISGALESKHQRNFGLFHYADRTEARVRNVIWRGDWPKELPSTAEQLLAAPDHECLSGLDDLLEVDRYRMATEYSNLFELKGARWQDATSAGPDGLTISMRDVPAWRVVQLTMKQPLYGDFDASLVFDRLESVTGVGRNDFILKALDDSAYVVGCGRYSQIDGQERCSSTLAVPNPDGTKRNTGSHIIDETTAGTLRIVRRGETLHMLIAAEGSQHFRYAGHQTVPSAGSAVTLQIVLNATQNATLSVRLKEMIIRSNSKAAAKLRDPRVSQLNKYTAVLPRKDQHTFAISGLTGFDTTDPSRSKVTESGLQIRAGEGEPTRLAYDRSVSGDFDVAALLNVVSLSGNSSIRLVAETGASNSEAVQLVIEPDDEGFNVIARKVEGESTGEIAAARSSAVDGLRLVRIQKTVFFLYSESGIYRVLGQTAVDSGPVPKGGLRLDVSPSGSDESPNEVIWKQLRLRSAGLEE